MGNCTSYTSDIAYIRYELHNINQNQIHQLELNRSMLDIQREVLKIAKSNEKKIEEAYKSIKSENKQI